MFKQVKSICSKDGLNAHFYESSHQHDHGFQRVSPGNAGGKANRADVKRSPLEPWSGEKLELWFSS